MDTHGPYEPPGEFRTKYAKREISDRDAQSLYRRAIKDPESITDDEQQLLIDLYDGEIRYNDEQIRVFLDELRKRDLIEDSLIIFTADHGDAFGEHGYYEHPRYLHPELTHVPLFVRPPGGADKTIDVPASTLDVVATIEDAIGREGSGDGVSLLGSLPEDRRVFSQVRGEDENIHIRRYAIRNRNDVVYCERDQNTEEIRFTNDSDQSLRDELREFVEERVQIEKGMDTEDDEVNDEIERRLSALGYKE
jgi:arylsulfatase